VAHLERQSDHLYWLLTVSTRFSGHRAGNLVTGYGSDSMFIWPRGVYQTLPNYEPAFEEGNVKGLRGNERRQLIVVACHGQL